MDISVVTLSKHPAPRRYELPYVNHVGQFTNAAELLQARIDAIRKVETKWFFFLDDDDALPDDYLRVLDLCMATDTPIAYTNELVRLPDGRSKIRMSAPYSQDAHVHNFSLIHHLAVCRTDAAKRAAAAVPRGTFGFEPLVWFQVAKEGATWVDEVGYIWNRREGSMSRHPSLLIGMVQSATWAHRNRT